MQAIMLCELLVVIFKSENKTKIEFILHTGERLGGGGALRARPCTLRVRYIFPCGNVRYTLARM
jgi:hypothetical protein